MELVEVENLTYTYPGAASPAVREVGLALSPGEFVLLLGASGSGKSTLCRALNGLVPHFYGGTFEGTVRIAGSLTTEVDVKDLAGHVGMVFQDPEGQLVTDNPVSEIAFGIENLGVGPVAMRKRVAEALATLRLTPLRDRRNRELSGGQKQKVALASVLVMHPELLVLDEPTSQLDPVSAEDFLATVRSLNDELGLCVVLAEHRVERCLHFADRIIVLEGGEVAFNGLPRELSAWASDRPNVALPPITRLFIANGLPPPLTVKEGRDRLAAITGGGEDLREVKPTPGDEGTETGSRKDEQDAPLVRVSGLRFAYPDGTEALKGIDLEIGNGEFVALIGENGSGKSTLVKHFNGLLKPGRGKVVLDGKDTRDSEVAELAKTCGMLGQNPNYQLISDTVRGELQVTLDAIGVPVEEHREMIDEVSGLLDLNGMMEKNPQDLSCGERERVALASVMVYRPRLLVLDEPTRGVDWETKMNLGEYLREYNSHGNTVVLVTHDLEFAAECCLRVVMLSEGITLADGPRNEVLSESLFFTTQFNKSFRGIAEGVVTREDAQRALEALQ